MSTVDLNKAADITPVTAPYVRATSASTVEIELPQAFNRAWISLRADSERIWFKFVVGIAGAASGVSLVETTVSTVSGSGNLVAAHTDSAFVIEAGQQMDFDLNELKLQSNQAVKILHKAPTAGGWLRFYLSSGPVS